MNRFARLVAVAAGLVLLLNVTPSWSQPTCASPGCNPTVSDANANTAGGTDAFGSIDETASGGFSNTAFGDGALGNTTTGDFNTAIGQAALQANVTASENTAVGQGALQSNAGGKNTATGMAALNNNTSGHHNAASGWHALITNTTGSKNTAFGTQALLLSTGEKNIGIGYQAGSALTSGNNNIYVGNPGATSESLTMRLGSVQTSTFIAGVVGTTVSGGTPVEIDANGQLGVAGVSSARYKRDIAPMGTSSEKVLALRPVIFAYKDDAQHVTHYGLIAEEVEKVYPELVTHTATGEVQAVRYQELIPMLLNELQHERQEVQQALQALQHEQHELAALRALVGQGREMASFSR